MALPVEPQGIGGVRAGFVVMQIYSFRPSNFHALTLRALRALIVQSAGAAGVAA